MTWVHQKVRIFLHPAKYEQVIINYLLQNVFFSNVFMNIFVYVCTFENHFINIFVCFCRNQLLSLFTKSYSEIRGKKKKQQKSLNVSFFLTACRLVVHILRQFNKFWIDLFSLLTIGIKTVIFNLLFKAFVYAWYRASAHHACTVKDVIFLSICFAYTFCFFRMR